MPKEKHCKKDIGGSCLYSMSNEGTLEYDLLNQLDYESEKLILIEQQKK